MAMLFLEGVLETANGAAQTTQAILQIFAEDRCRIETLGRSASSALRVFGQLQAGPLLTITKAAEVLHLSVPTIITAVQNLEELDIIQELTGRPRKRLYVYRRYLDILNEGAESLRQHQLKNEVLFFNNTRAN